MDSFFTIDLGELTPDQLQALADLGPTVQVNTGQLDDEEFTRLLWLLKRRRPLNLESPRTFSEKIQWLKLRARDPAMVPVADKLAVRSFVAERVGSEYLNELHFVGDDLADADLDALPRAFMVRCTHGCRWNVAVPDKNAADWTSVTERVRYWLSLNYYRVWREWVYEDIPPRVLVERLLEDHGPLGLLDYKVLCFGGRALYVQVDIGRAGHHTRAFYDTAWRRVPCAVRHPSAEIDVPAPPNLATMLEVAEALAGGFPFVRVDLFNVAGSIVFGEMTFFPSNGLWPFTPPEYERMLGEALVLPEVARAGA